MGNEFRLKCLHFIMIVDLRKIMCTKIGISEKGN